MSRLWQILKKLPLLVMILILGLGFTACLKKVDRIAVDDVRDISGRWNDTDSRLTSEEMIADCLARPWVGEFKSSNSGNRPVVIVGTVANKTIEHINTETFVKDLERALLNSGKVRFVANKGERMGVRDERDDMAEHATKSTRKAKRQEKGADFMMIGAINAISDQEKKERVVLYQVELELVSMVDNEKVWIGQKKLKKYIKSPNKKF